VKSLYFRIFSASFVITFLSSEISTLLAYMFLFHCHAS
jgi:hypothetical protein